MKSSVTKPAAAVEQCQVKSRKLCDFFFFKVRKYVTRLKGTVRYSYETYGD